MYHLWRYFLTACTVVAIRQFNLYEYIDTGNPRKRSHNCSCITVTWWSGPGGIQALSERPTGFLQCFDTAGLVV